MIMYLTAAVCFLLTAGMAGPGNRIRPAVFPAVTGFLLLSIHIGMFVFSLHRLPLVGGYESISVLAWTLAGLLVARPRYRDDRAVLVLFGLALTLLCAAGGLARLQLNHDYFMYVSPLAQGFFFLKQLSAGVMLTATLGLTVALISGRKDFDRQLFMAGAIVFLCSELSGSIWCLLGWGDSWHWSDNFFESAMVFFLFMLNFHLPVSLTRRIPWRLGLHLGTAAAITGLFIW